MGAYENPQVAIVDYSAFSRNFMASFQLWSNMWEKRRLANTKNKGKAEAENLKRLQGTFVKPEKELGVMWTDRMTEIFRQQVDQNVWANASASEKQQIIEKVQTEANGAKAIQQAINLNLENIDQGTNPDLYGLVNAVQGFSSGNKNEFEMVGGRYNISGDDSYNRSNNSNFAITPGQIGLTYKYKNDDGENVYYNADELHDVLVNMRDADKIYNGESEEEMEVIAGVVNIAGKNFKTISNSKRLENKDARDNYLAPYIENGTATENGWNYDANITRELDKWINNEDNYDLAAGIFRNYIPGFEGHVYRPSVGQLEQMIEDEGKYILKQDGKDAFAKYEQYVDGIYKDGKITEEEKNELWAAQDEALIKKLTNDVWKTGEIDQQFIIPPEEEVFDEGDGDDDDFLTVNEIDIAGGTQEQLRTAKNTLGVLNDLYNTTSSRKANVASLSDPDIMADLKADEDRYSKIIELADIGLLTKNEVGFKKYLTSALNKDEDVRSENEKEAIKLYQDSMATWDPDVQLFLNENLEKLYTDVQYDPLNKKLKFSFAASKKRAPVYVDLKDKEEVKKLYSQMVGATGQKAKDIYRSLYGALYGKDYFKQ